jgi:predicted glycoside hydrolase/deacetylase ChbG (UPF0249 family)
VSNLIALLRRLPDGITELCCHPGYADDLDSVYCAERVIELHTLCASEVRPVLEEEEIHLRSFGDAMAES